MPTGLIQRTVKGEQSKRIILSKSCVFIAASFCVLFTPFFTNADNGNEIIPNHGRAKVIVREHAKTGKPYVVLVNTDAPSHQLNPSFETQKRIHRPDYELLNPKVKSGQVFYDGPVSDRRKVYILAGSLAAVGVAAGVTGFAVPAVSTGSASSGAGLYATGGAAVASATTAAVSAAHYGPHSEDGSLTARSEMQKPASANKYSN